MPTKILQSKIFHTRHHPVKHSFVYSGIYIMLDLQNHDISESFLSINKKNLYSISTENYGHYKFDNFYDYINSEFSKLESGIKLDKVYLLTLPKILGYVFNPVSFWLCYDVNQNLVAVLSEVNNTFGERHSYWCYNEQFSTINNHDYITKNKAFYVSPFFDCSGYYKFRFNINENNIVINIDYYDDDNILLSTGINGKLSSFTNQKLITNIMLLPFLSLKVITLIHYNALILWLKKIKIFPRTSKLPPDIT